SADSLEPPRWSVGLEAAPEDRGLWRRLAEIYNRRTAADRDEVEVEAGESPTVGTADPVLLRRQEAALIPRDGATIVDADSIPPNYFEVSEAAAAAAAAAAATTSTPAPGYFNGEPPDKNLGIGSEVPASVDPAEAMAACQPPWCYPAKCTSSNPNCPPIVCPPGTEAKLRPDGSGVYQCVATTPPCVPACKNGGVCTKSRCVCPVGFTGDYCESVNKRQCRLLTGRICDYGCRQVGTEYRCLCPPWISAPPGGFGPGSNLTCVPADPNGAPDEPCRAPCLNGVCRGGACVCRPGWRGDDCGRDVDECADEWLNRCMYRCANTIGSFRCECPPGYRLSPLDGTSCEPLVCPPDCGPPGGRCVDGRCACQPGWTGDSCRRDVDECASNHADGRPAAARRCAPGSFRCRCPPGQRLGSDGRSCAPSNSCEPACRPDTGACVNGSCACRSGWSGPDCASDTDECALGFHACRHGCANTPGSFRCLCPPGYRLAADGRNCRPDDPRACSDRLRPCQNGGACDSGSRRCRCPPGFYGDFCQKAAPTTTTTSTTTTSAAPTTVRPGEECRPPCQHGRCIRGGCVCDSGFEGAACQIRFRCTGSADCSRGWCGADGRCVCLAGWRGLRCDMDFNECDLSPAPCEHSCHNLPGTFRCTCDPGFNVGTNGSCVWAGDPSCPRGCRNGGRCRSGRCRCAPGYRGPTCSADVDECAMERSVHGCEFACYNTRGSWECRCPPGYTRLSDRRTCRLSPPDSRCQPPCLNGGVCRLAASGIGNCACQRGFAGPDCGSDVDECALYRPCQHQCVNTVGSYTCRCPAGQLLRFDGVRCITPEEAAGRPDLLYRGTGVKGPTVAP
uniref:EGF-like domain-containing protein n=1 Tax=Macrostomum lignano TaxID=282301 RepID=A0A1I8GCU0_9PLAT